MKCPNCGSRTIHFFMGDHEICLSCGYGSAALLDTLVDSPLDKLPSPELVDTPSPWLKAFQTFLCKLFGELGLKYFDQNYLFSPSELFQVLTLLCRGATHETLASMVKVLEFQPQFAAEIIAGCGEYRDRAQSITGWTSASALCTRKDILFRPEFSNLNKEYFQIEEIHHNFTDPLASQHTNSWVYQKTRGIIRQMGYRLDSYSLLMVMSVACFLMDALPDTICIPFEHMSFTGLDGASFDASGLQIAGRLAMVQDDQFKAVRLDSQQPGLSLYLFQPQNSHSPAEFLAGLTPQLWREWQLKFRFDSGLVCLPVFHIECQTSYAATLRALGMGYALDEVRASFENLCAIPPNPEMYIDEIRQAAVLEFSPRVSKETTQMVPLDNRLVEIKFDRPFAFLLADTQTGAILLAGSLVRPT